MKGYVHLYTGNGKGKTTAALGLSLRAAGAGRKVFFAQFVKGQLYSELTAVRTCVPAITIRQYGLDCFIINEPTEADRDAARRGMEEVSAALMSGYYDVVVMDEINIAIYYKLVSSEEVTALLSRRPEHVEVVLTGRYAPDALIDHADLVTEMKEVKHYYTKGISARKGIEH